MPEVDIISARRVVARPADLDAATWPEGSLVLRFAPDDVLLIGEGEVTLADPHTVVEGESGYSGVWMEEAAALVHLATKAAWLPDSVRPVLASGMVAGLPARVYLDGGRALVMVPTPFAAELADRLG
ncbi:MAG: hypothetical protein ACT4OP_08435 [Actinomycetota bacterium]